MTSIMFPCFGSFSNSVTFNPKIFTPFSQLVFDCNCIILNHSLSPKEKTRIFSITFLKIKFVILIFFSYSILAAFFLLFSFPLVWFECEWSLKNRFYCCFSLCVIVLPWSQLFPSALLFLWLPFPPVHYTEYIWQCCFCFDLLFFPNFPPSLPRALSYSQDIKVIHAKDLIKALLSQNTTTSHSALLTFISIDSDLLQFILFIPVLSFPFF